LGNQSVRPNWRIGCARRCGGRARPSERLAWVILDRPLNTGRRPSKSVRIRDSGEPQAIRSAACISSPGGATGLFNEHHVGRRLSRKAWLPGEGRRDGSGTGHRAWPWHRTDFLDPLNGRRPPVLAIRRCVDEGLRSAVLNTAATCPLSLTVGDRVVTGQDRLPGGRQKQNQEKPLRHHSPLLHTHPLFRTSVLPKRQCRFLRPLQRRFTPRTSRTGRAFRRTGAGPPPPHSNRIHRTAAPFGSTPL
jgi:hypothetical protein